MQGEFFEHIVERELFVLRWREPAPEAVEALNQVIGRRARDNGGPLTVITIIDAQTPVPDRATRAALEQAMLTHSPDEVSGFHAVLVGEGIKMTIIRSILTGLMIVVGMRGKQATIHRDIAGMAKLIGAREGHDAHAFLDWLCRHTFISSVEVDAARLELSSA